MSKHEQDLETFVNTMVSPGKIASADLDNLSLHELETLLGLDLGTDTEKVAYLGACVKEAYGDDRYGTWLDQFEGSPLKAKALALCEQELALEQERLQKRIERDAQCQDDSATWTKQDMLRLQKDMLMLELHKSKTGAGGGKDPAMAPVGGAEIQDNGDMEEVPAKPGKTTPPKGDKTASDGVQMVGQVNNGDPNPPEWPRATLGVDAAGRRATPEEENAQRQAGMDVQFRKAEASKSAGAATQLGEAVMKHVDRMPGVAQRALGHATSAGKVLGGKTTEQALGRGLMAAGGAAAGAAGAAGLATRKKESALITAVEAALGRPFGSEKGASLSRALHEVAPDVMAEMRDRSRKRVSGDSLKSMISDMASGRTTHGSIDEGVDSLKSHITSRALAGGAVGGVAGGLASRKREKHTERKKEANVMGTLAMDVASQSKHLARMGSYARNVQKVPHAVVAARNAEMRAAKALPMPHVDLNAPRPVAHGPASVATKKTPTQAINPQAALAHAANTVPQQVIQGAVKHKAPAMGTATLLDQLSRTSFDKLARMVA